MGRLKSDMADSPAVIDLSDRSREIFRGIVEAYVETGAPVGSRTLSRKLGLNLSPATIRNIMADLEDLGLLYAPHTSAGRMPTHLGLRLFVSKRRREGRAESTSWRSGAVEGSSSSRHQLPDHQS